MENKPKIIRMTICVPADLHKRIRIAAAESDQKNQEYIINCIKFFIDKKIEE